LVVTGDEDRQELVPETLAGSNGTLRDILAEGIFMQGSGLWPTLWRREIAVQPAGDPFYESHPSQMGNHVSHLPLVAGARPLPVLWRQCTEEVFESLCLRMHGLGAVCIRVHPKLLIFLFLSGGPTPNAGAHLPPEAGAERTLEAVRCSALFGAT
jgi:hypothetical protein